MDEPGLIPRIEHGPDQICGPAAVGFQGERFIMICLGRNDRRKMKQIIRTIAELGTVMTIPYVPEDNFCSVSISLLDPVKSLLSPLRFAKKDPQPVFMVFHQLIHSGSSHRSASAGNADQGNNETLLPLRKPIY